MDDTIDYEAEYNNSARVENSDELINQYIIDAAVFREARTRNSELDLSYGSEDRNKIDIFWPKKKVDCPIVVFIHGGYWQRLDRSSFSHLAKGLNAKGVAVAMPSYTLCPDISIAGIVNEMRRACVLLYQTYLRPLTVVGHSAGGHLAACMMATKWSEIHSELPDDLVQSGMGISGIYDLLPLLQTPINDALDLTSETAVTSSPIEWIPDGLHRFEAWVGGDESDEFHRQSRDLAARWGMLGTPTNYVSVPGTNHFTVVNELLNTSTPMLQRLLEIIIDPVSEPDIPEPSTRALARAKKQFKQEDDEAVKGFAVLEAERKARESLSEDQPEQTTDNDDQETGSTEQVQSTDDVDDPYRLTT